MGAVAEVRAVPLRPEAGRPAALARAGVAAFPARPARSGDRATLVADVRHLHVFDPGTDAAIGQASSAALPGREERACC